MSLEIISLSGIIEFNTSGSWETIKLIQENGYKIDLVGRFKEAMESFDGLETKLSYYISDHPCGLSQMKEEWLKKLSGSIDAAYETNSYSYSSMTSGTDYDTTLAVGGHNIFKELSGEQGKFIIIELVFSDVLKMVK